MIYVGCPVEIRPAFDSTGEELDALGHCAGWVRQVDPASDDVAIEFRSGEVVWVHVRRIVARRVS